MPRMVRKQIYIERRQDEILKRRAKELGVTEAELVRRAIDQIGRVGVEPAPDPKVWKEELEYIKKHRGTDVPQTGWQWTRD